MLNHILIKHKKIFECFNCFWKVFFFLKNFKNYAILFWRFCLACQASHEPPVVSLHKALGDSLSSQGPSREKDLEKFQKLGFLGFLRLSLATGSRVEAPVMRFTQNDSQLPSRLTRELTFQS